jgi:vanillate monooxygenase ferredoxin subunit
MSTSPTLLTVRVVYKVVEALDIARFELVAVEGETLPKFQAGAHIDVHLPNGLVRPYSLCNSPDETHRYVIAVLNDAQSRGGSKAMHELVQEGQTLQISSPRNLFALTSSQAKRSVLLAGGIGITPLLSMAEQLSAQGQDFELHYCTRSLERTAFHAYLSQAAFAERVHFHLDEAEPSQHLDWNRVLASPHPNDHLYVCGPQGFIDKALQTATAQGWSTPQQHSEAFKANTTSSSTETGIERAFQVKLASTGQVIDVSPSETVAQALVNAGANLLTSCEQGVCGTCLTRVLEGVPDHRDSYLLPEEQAQNDQFLPCCSRAHSALLVLDL